jgi:hypothetical protein
VRGAAVRVVRTALTSRHQRRGGIAPSGIGYGS